MIFAPEMPNGGSIGAVPMTDVLQDLREEIDDIDNALVELLARRLRIVDRVVTAKQQHGIPATVPERVESVIAHVRGLALKRQIPAAMAERLWRLLIAETIAYEEAALKARDPNALPKAG